MYFTIALSHYTIILMIEIFVLSCYFYLLYYYDGKSDAIALILIHTCMSTIRASLHTQIYSTLAEYLK